MQKRRVEGLIEDAVAYRKDHPETPLSVFELVAVSLLGADISRRAQPVPREILGGGTGAELIEAICELHHPFTAAEVAEKVNELAGVKNRPSRGQARNTGHALRRVLGYAPRKSNGKLVYDLPSLEWRQANAKQRPHAHTLNV